MINDLNPQHGIEVWINKVLEKTIEDAFKKILKTDTLYYFFDSYEYEENDKGEIIKVKYDIPYKKKVKWVGNVSLIDYIKKIQSLKNNGPVLYVTSLSSKGAVVNCLEEDEAKWSSDDWRKRRDEPDKFDQYCYWIGDCRSPKSLICCDGLFGELFDRIRDHVAKQPDYMINRKQKRRERSEQLEKECIL